MTALGRMALLLLALTVIAGPAQANDDWGHALTGAASHLWAALPDETRVAVRPLDPDESGLPEPLLVEVERALTAALLATAPAGATVLARRDLPALWEETASFTGGLPRNLLTDAAVDALVVPTVGARDGGLSVSATLIGLRDAGLGAVLATLPPTFLAADLATVDVVEARAGARRLGVGLAEGLRLAVGPGSAFAVRVERRGPRGSAADWFAAMVAEHLVQRLAAPPLYVARPLRRLGEAPAARVVALHLELWDQGSRLDAQARARMGSAEAHGTARIALTSIPNGFLPLTRDGGRVGKGLYRAVGHFAPAQRTDPREIRFASRVLARAALIEDGLGQGGGTRRAAGAADIATAMQSLTRAIPFEEIWQDGAEGGGAAQELAARLARLGGGGAPRVDAAVERALYRPGDSLRARVTVQGGRAYLAAYAWQADDTVVRIAPPDRAARLLEADRRADLPGPRDAQVTAAPLPGSVETLEALLLVASAMPFDADALAPAAGATAEGSLAAAAQMSAFLDALAALDLSRVSLAVLPYRTRAAE